MKSWFVRGSFSILLFWAAACGETGYQFRSFYKDTSSLLYQSASMKNKPFLKAHLISGDVIILTDTWQVDSLGSTVSGTGQRFDFNRRTRFSGAISVPVDSVVLFETNEKLIGSEKSRLTALTVLFTAEAGLGIFCLVNPKACFGSCPTFYLKDAGSVHFSDAEGFSNAIAPSLEYGDTDALRNHVLTDSVLTLTMKNEALETHCLNSVQILAVPLKQGERAYQTSDDRYFLSDRQVPLSAATGPEGDISALISRDDLTERFSPADSSDLNSREELILEFTSTGRMEQAAVHISFRQTLMTTFFIYSAIGYMGDEYGDLMARMERGENLAGQLDNGIKKELGNIDVYSWQAKTGNWQLEGGLYETGPIAFNRQIVPLKNPVDGKSRIKLVLNKGLWRVNEVSLVSLKGEVFPEVLQVNRVQKNGIESPSSLTDLTPDKKYLVSMPGDSWKLSFPVKKTGEFELFLRTQGYYLEWMRETWMKEKNMGRLWQLVFTPDGYLEDVAEEYKEYEKTMEATFWNSRISTRTVTYENK